MSRPTNSPCSSFPINPVTRPQLLVHSSSGPRFVSSPAAPQILPSTLHDAPVVRLAIHPGDSAVPSLLTSIDRVLDRLCRRRSLARYADLVPLDI
jgi:hypothetical protein